MASTSLRQVAVAVAVVGVGVAVSLRHPLVAPGDITGNGVVDLFDFNAIVVDWGSTGSSLSSDLNRDGVVDILDFNILIVNWSA